MNEKVLGLKTNWKIASIITKTINFAKETEAPKGRVRQMDMKYIRLSINCIEKLMSIFLSNVLQKNSDIKTNCNEISFSIIQMNNKIELKFFVYFWEEKNVWFIYWLQNKSTVLWTETLVFV